VSEDEFTIHLEGIDPGQDLMELMLWDENGDLPVNGWFVAPEFSYGAGDTFVADLTLWIFAPQLLDAALSVTDALGNDSNHEETTQSRSRCAGTAVTSSASSRAKLS
jgi:hypothetical protein